MIMIGLQKQSYTDFELIIAEDDNAEGTVDYLKELSARMPFPVRHISQRDQGFRKNEVLNKAVVAATGDFLVFLDGDVIPHRMLLKEYITLAGEGIVFAGRRVMISETLTQKILATCNLRLLSFFYLLRYGSKYPEEGIYLPFYQRSKSSGLLGCNWGILKKHLVAINGFDEDYISYGVGEDLDIEWRLVRNGIKLQSMRHRAIVYHLYHRSQCDAAAIEANYVIMRKKQALGSVYCVNGLDKHLSKK
jgi:glycosyltransferase involved in cell wall biosynthesis